MVYCKQTVFNGWKGHRMILSVSRRTDIPNYYFDWFRNRIRAGFLYVQNPMNPHQVSRIRLSPEVVDCIVFWTKNPSAMLEQLDVLKGYTYYVQFTLTGYGKEIEPGLPDKRSVLIPAFRRLSERIGRERVIWRYDPIFLNERYSMDYHQKAFGEIAEHLAGYTEQVVISFLDLYAKIRKRAKDFQMREMRAEEIRQIAGEMARIAAGYGLTVETCAEKIDLQDVGIRHGCCIDKNRIERILGCRLTGGKDRNQRAECGCMESIDVGAYHTCLNGCRYCYANFSEEYVREKAKRYDPEAELLCGRIRPEDHISERTVKSFRDEQMTLWRI